MCIVATGFVAAACGSGGGSSSDAEAQLRYSDLQFIFARSCATSSCHGQLSTDTGNLQLSPTGAYCNLTGATAGATYRDGARADFPRRVVPGDRARSFLYQKITLTDAQMGETQPLGSRMPKDSMLDAAEIERFGRWIDAGALDNSGTTGSCQ
jgi:hypothetical protein